MLGLARSLRSTYRTQFMSFAEGGRCRALMEQVRRHGFEGRVLDHNFPHVAQAAREVARLVRQCHADVLCCSGYKPDVIGWLAGRQAGVPVVSISHGWTAATLKVRCYESVNRLVLRWMDAVVCVSQKQADKVRSAGVAQERIVVIHNAIDATPFAQPDASYRARLHQMFARPRRRIVGAAGRLSPEKGYDHLIAAAARVAAADPEIGFVLFGDGKLRPALERQVASLGLAGRFVLAGFHTDVERYLPFLDLAVLSSHTEGLPVVVLEALAAGVPVVATAVGGVPEVIDDGIHGYLVPPGDPAALAERILKALTDEVARRDMGERGRVRVRQDFSFARQSELYRRLFERMTHARGIGLRRSAGFESGVAARRSNGSAGAAAIAPAGRCEDGRARV